MELYKSKNNTISLIACSLLIRVNARFYCTDDNIDTGTTLDFILSTLKPCTNINVL